MYTQRFSFLKNAKGISIFSLSVFLSFSQANASDFRKEGKTPAPKNPMSLAPTGTNRDHQDLAQNFPGGTTSCTGIVILQGTNACLGVPTLEG
ncbi:hypothetical protein IM40_07010 [Candidatus Paracaedimonas acanthamoebae]|nr:hypothetical protein IM40_07010 [Candidatus Paracaedimonas acanthamoebae]